MGIEIFGDSEYPMSFRTTAVHAFRSIVPTFFRLPEIVKVPPAGLDMLGIYFTSTPID